MQQIISFNLSHFKTEAMTDKKPVFIEGVGWRYETKHRQTRRHPTHDYGGVGTYLVTMIVAGRANVIAAAMDGVVIVSPGISKGEQIIKHECLAQNLSFLITKKVTFKCIEYALEVGGVKVTSANKDNILVNSGKALFDPARNALCLYDAVIAPAKGTQGIVSDIPLIINVEGSSKITTDGDYAIQANKGLLLESNGDESY